MFKKKCESWIPSKHCFTSKEGSVLRYLVCFLGPCPSPAPPDDSPLPWLLEVSFFWPSLCFWGLFCFSDLFSFSFFFLSLSSAPVAETGLYSTPVRDLYCTFSWRSSCTAVSTWSFSLTKEGKEQIIVFHLSRCLSTNVQLYKQIWKHN